MPAVVGRAKKVRVQDEGGKWRWVDGPLPPASVQQQAVVALTGTILGFDEDGDEITDDGPGYDDYLTSLPSREDRRRLSRPERYWEVRWPGCTLQPYPTLGSFSSTPSGLWQVEYPYQARAVREHILANIHVDPDELAITDDDWQIMDGRKDGRIQYCQSGGCHFVSCNLTAISLHQDITGHAFHNKPRED